MTTPHTPTHTAPNTRRPWYRRRAYRAAAVTLTGGALIAADAIQAATDPEAGLIHGALAMAAALLIARGCLEVRPCYRRPTPEEEAARMDG